MQSAKFDPFGLARPLIQGEVVVPYENGLPVFARLDKNRVEKILPAFGTAVE